MDELYQSRNIYLEVFPKEKDDLYDMKEKMIGAKNHREQEFFLRRDLEKEDVVKCLSFARWITFKDKDFEKFNKLAYRSREIYVEFFVADMAKEGKDLDNMLEDEEMLEGSKTCYTGGLPAHDKLNEVAAWNLIKQPCKTLLE